MQRISVGLFKKPVKTLSAKSSTKVTGNNIVEFPAQFVAAEFDVATAAAAA